jgi:hypothetical protein
MRVPQVKEAPAKGLRAMFAGIGQLLSMTDKLRGKSAASPDPETVVPATAPPQTAATQAAATETAAPQTAAPETAAPETVVAETVIPEVKAAAKPRTAAKPRAAAKPAAAKPAPAAPAAPAAAAAAETTAPGGHVRLVQPDEAPAAQLPLANYDELTVPSLRARLRNLSADQLGQLIAYEKSHADRADVITMFERRVTKLAEG